MNKPDRAPDRPDVHALAKFADPDWTAGGLPRAKVGLDRLDTLWFNTGTRCNIACAHCYILSSPSNDALVYITAAEVERFLDEIAAHGLPTREIGFTGGEPFMNPEMPAMAELALSRGFEVLILTNGMRPMMRPRVRARLADLAARYGARLTLRISLDHYRPENHDAERGRGAFATTIEGMRWLKGAGVRMTAAARTLWGETEAQARAGFRALFSREGFDIDADRRDQLVLFPELDETASVPEISVACWQILDKAPGEVMCATARMVAKRKGARRPVVLACTLLAYDEAFELGATLAEAHREVALNHPHCAKFCVLGGARCSG